MINPSWLSGLARRAVRRSRFRTDFLAAPSQLAHLAVCERSRVDRNGSVLSILRSKNQYANFPIPSLRLASEQLQTRLRITDTAGFSSDGRLMLLLPDTPVEGAVRVAEDLRKLLSTSLGDVEFEIATYPDELALGKNCLNDQQLSIDQGRSSCARPSGLQIESKPADMGAYSAQSVESFFEWRCPVWKRGIDIVGASLGMVVAAPLIGVAAVLIRFTSPGDAIFSQYREGVGGRPFKIYKLRTMRQDAESLKDSLRLYSEQDGPAFKMTNDPRITPLGRFLRMTSIDELPQLWNVLKGDMSLVGPRPLPIDESQSCQPWQRRRLSVRPGLTCIWQVRGRNVVSFDEWARMDLRYIKRRSFWYDLYLIASTAPAVVAKRNGR